MPEEFFNPDDNIIGVLGLGTLPEAERVKLLDQMSDLIQKRVIIRVMEKLSDDDAKAAEQLSEKPDELAAFLSAKVPEMPAILDEEVRRLKNELAAEAAEEAAPQQ